MTNFPQNWLFFVKKQGITKKTTPSFKRYCNEMKFEKKHGIAKTAFLFRHKVNILNENDHFCLKNNVI